MYGRDLRKECYNSKPKKLIEPEEISTHPMFLLLAIDFIITM